MKTQTAKLNYLRIAPRKVRLIASSIKGLLVSEAEAQLLLSSRKAAEPIVKLLRSAIANAKNSQQLDSAKLFIKEIRVDQGPVLKRFMPRAMGRATSIHKKSSHITLIIAESEKPKESRFKITKRERVTKTVRAKQSKTLKDKDMSKPKAEEVAKPPQKQGFIKRIFRRKAV